ncbi:L,D-transpeptidase family protein [Flavobacterium xueshanense]|uniref:Murein L,D-transpeptidase YcbB/YkuD n=1 Tax=Flavobacterium xueshanense TaxID=935223 RepID=A0A1I2API6_9FLAO|nr:L,D-transpeptidase family protein [Flavobacterium xueshanense]SFE44800.1 Murein L,D-transpeptidase YcbB/YkuD [Flavobacterium xueshanense]
MKNVVLSIALLLFSFSLAYSYRINAKTVTNTYCTQTFPKYKPERYFVKIDSLVISRFFKTYPNLKKYKSDIQILYTKRDYNSIWLDDKGVIEFANLLYSKVNQLEEEGLLSRFAYKERTDLIFNKNAPNNLTTTETELLLSAMYIFYAKKVYKGIDIEKIKEMGWFLPTKNLSYATLLNSLLADPELLDKNEKQLFSQYYKLRTVLKKYRQIEQNGDWNLIVRDSSILEYKPGDNSQTIGQIRQRLAVTGDLEQDSKSNLYDEELMSGILNFKRRNGYKPDHIITSSLIQRMNIPIENYIKAIMVNMERCRWITPELTKAEEYIIINIPSFKLIYKRNGTTELESNVFVGGTMNETVIFSSNISHLIFSPYWNIPTSIVQSEIKTAMDRDKNYLADNDMEYNKGRVRQKPGPKNLLGKVKFMFPSASDIYLHDSPAKSLFDSEYRAYSHGCINVNKAQELAYLILKNDGDWPADRIKKAMDGGKETTCILKKKIPVHIGYFTTWVNDADEVSFFNDIYQRDDRLAELLFSDDTK